MFISVYFNFITIHLWTILRVIHDTQAFPSKRSVRTRRPPQGSWVHRRWLRRSPGLRTSRAASRPPLCQTCAKTLLPRHASRARLFPLPLVLSRAASHARRGIAWRARRCPPADRAPGRARRGLRSRGATCWPQSAWICKLRCCTFKISNLN